MAYVGPYTCSMCNQPRHEIVMPNHVCTQCRIEDAKAEAKERRRYLAGLKGLTTEERLALLEAESYDLQRKVSTIDGRTAEEPRY